MSLKEAIDDLEWPGSSIQITLQPDPPSVTFRGDGHGDLEVDLHFSIHFHTKISEAKLIKYYILPT